MTIRSIALAGVAALACAPALATTFAYDNGVTTVAVGPPSSFPVNPVTGWGNYFMSDVGGTKITSVSCAFGPSFSVTTPVTIYLFADADNDYNPLNATLLTQVTANPVQVGGSVFTTFDIPDTVVNGGFFVLATAVTVKGVDKPAAGDLTGRTDRSWYFYNPATSGMNVANLGANALAKRVDQVLPLPGAWLLRAEGQAVVPAPGALILAGASGLLGLRRRRS
ncbi:MAG: hypothetical protein U0573_12635 [Phycisphaerales bacterium]|nr:hypothetical protein [Planctomycetota bacterium]